MAPQFPSAPRVTPPQCPQVPVPASARAAAEKEWVHYPDAILRNTGLTSAGIALQVAARPGGGIGEGPGRPTPTMNERALSFHFLPASIEISLEVLQVVRASECSCWDLECAVHARPILRWEALRWEAHAHARARVTTRCSRVKPRKGSTPLRPDIAPLLQETPSAKLRTSPAPLWVISQRILLTTCQRSRG